jgi:hypothetical protein
MDDLMSALHWAGQLHGIPSDDCQYKLDGQAYADGTNAYPLQMKACNT